MGVFEIDSFATGTKELAEAVAASDCVSIVGGGDSVTAAVKFGVADDMTFISTGGGASLELLEGKDLPGVTALTEANSPSFSPPPTLASNRGSAFLCL